MSRHLAESAAAHGTHIGECKGGRIDIIFAYGGCFFRQLHLYAFGAKITEASEGINAFFELLVSIEGGRILLYIRFNQSAGAVDDGDNVHRIQKFFKIPMVHFRIGFIGKNPVPHGSVLTGAARYGKVDGGVDGALRVSALKSAEGEIIVPRNHGHTAVFFVKVVVVNHGSCIAVAVNGEIVNDEIRTMIGDAVASHSGEWTTSKRSKVVLPSPQNLVQELVHLSDYIASRSDIHILFEGEDSKPKMPDLNEFKLTFGKHNGKTIPEIAVVDRGWLVWAQDNLTREPLLTLIKKYLDEEDEI